MPLSPRARFSTTDSPSQLPRPSPGSKMLQLPVPMASYLHALERAKMLEDDFPPLRKIAHRIHAWSWQAFPIGMGTSAVYLTLASLHPHPHFITYIEEVFYYLNIVIFLFNTGTMLLQVILYHNQFKKLLFDPVIGVFVPMFVLSLATIIIGTVNYAIPYDRVSSLFVYKLFWIYVALALIVCYPMMMIWFNSRHALEEFNPADAFLVFPLMLVGTVGLNVLRVMSPTDPRSIGVLLVSYFFQGIGFLMTAFFLCLYILRIFTTGFLSGPQANGAFVACGPPGFTALALVQLGKSARDILPAFGLVSPSAGEIWYSAGVLGGLMLFGLAVFFFFFALLPYPFKLKRDLHQILGCWAVTFPNVGWISVMKVFGDIFNLEGFYVLHIIMTIAMCLTWTILFTCTIIAFWRREIFYDEDPIVALPTTNSSDTTLDMYSRPNLGRRESHAASLMGRRVVPVDVEKQEGARPSGVDGSDGIRR